MESGMDAHRHGFPRPAPANSWLSRGPPAAEWADDAHVSLLAPVAGSASAAISLLLHPSDKAEPTDLGSFETDDVDAVVDKVRATGGAIGSEPTDAPWGVREATVSDPDGNGLYITGPLRQE